MKLNLGCGDDIQEGYINIDLRSTHESVVVADVRNLPYQAETIDEIRAIDVYEHISFRESRQLLNHWVSLLKPGGLLYVQATSLIQLCNFTALADLSGKYKEIEISIARMFGGQDYSGNFHATAIHEALFKKYLIDAGIKGDIEVNDGNFGNRTNIRVSAYK